jgi:hypothetical protein
MILRVKNWTGFQHYKLRNPPWIKLHKSLLDDYEFQCLPIASKALAPMLWLLASEYRDGVIDAPTEKIAFRLRITVGEFNTALNPLIDSGFVITGQAASTALAERLQDADSETERETEKERESEEMPNDLEHWVFQIIQAYPENTYQHIFQVPHIDQDSIIHAINQEKGQAWIVLEGVKRYASSIGNPNMVMGMEKFFTKLQHRRTWGNGGTKQLSKLEQLEALRNADEQNGGELDQFNGRFSGSQDTRTGIPKTI